MVSVTFYLSPLCILEVVDKCGVVILEDYTSAECSLANGRVAAVIQDAVRKTEVPQEVPNVAYERVRKQLTESVTVFEQLKCPAEISFSHGLIPTVCPFQ